MVNGKEKVSKELIFNKSSDLISQLVNKIWLCRYPRCQYLIYNSGSEFNFEILCNSYDIKHKPTMIKNPQANAICERMDIHQVLGTMTRTSEIDMAESVDSTGIGTFIDNAAWAICSKYHTVLKASLGVAIFG